MYHIYWVRTKYSRKSDRNYGFVHPWLTCGDAVIKDICASLVTLCAILILATRVPQKARNYVANLDKDNQHSHWEVSQVSSQRNEKRKKVQYDIKNPFFASVVLFTCERIISSNVNLRNLLMQSSLVLLFSLNNNNIADRGGGKKKTQMEKKKKEGFNATWKNSKSRRRTGLTWQMGDVGGQQLGSLLLIALLRDVT